MQASYCRSERGCAQRGLGQYPLKKDAQSQAALMLRMGLKPAAKTPVKALFTGAFKRDSLS